MADNRQADRYRDRDIPRSKDERTKPRSANFSPHSKPYISVSEEVISQLANTLENRRARQVSEWERLQMRSIQRAQRVL